MKGEDGDDVPYGGPDSDTFRFFPSDLGGASIRDFSDGEDVIDLTEFTDISSMDDLDIVSHGDEVRGHSAGRKARPGRVGGAKVPAS